MGLAVHREHKLAPKSLLLLCSLLSSTQQRCQLSPHDKEGISCPADASLPCTAKLSFSLGSNLQLFSGLHSPCPSFTPPLQSPWDDGVRLLFGISSGIEKGHSCPAGSRLPGIWEGPGQRDLPDWNGTDLSLRRAEKLLCAAARSGTSGAGRQSCL